MAALSRLRYSSSAATPRESLSRKSKGPQEITKIPSLDARGNVKLIVMEIITRQVGDLLENERYAAELLLGHRLRGNERLILQVLDIDAVQPPEQLQTAESLPNWCNVYEGLTDPEVDTIQRSITRCNSTRSVE